MNEAQAREEICRAGASLFARGYVHATAGNISMRLPAEAGGGYLITPTDACLGRLDPAQLAHVAEDGTQTGGLRASKTLALHRRIYDAALAAGRPARCVLHTHATHLVALTLQRRWPSAAQSAVVGVQEILPPLTPYFVMKVGRVPLVPYHRPGAAAVADRVAALVAAYAQRGLHIRAVMLDRLGPNVWHDSPAEAMATLEELEETARLRLLAGEECTPLDAAQIAELREAFGASW